MKLPLYSEISSHIDSLQAPLQNKIACKSGCSFCCKQKVNVSLEELEIIQTYISTLSDLQKQKLRRISCANGLIYRENPSSNAPCALLNEDGFCSVYSVRPLTCRVYISLKVDTCKQFLTDPEAFIKDPESFDANYDDKAWGPILEIGDPLYELNHSIFVMVTYPNKWKEMLEPSLTMRNPF